MSARRERDGTNPLSMSSGTPRIKFEDATATTQPATSADASSPIDGNKSPRGGSGRFLRTSGAMIGGKESGSGGSTSGGGGGGSGGGVVFKLALPKEGSSSPGSNSPTSASGSAKSFTPRSMLNKVKHTFSISGNDDVDLTASGAVTLASASSGGSATELTSGRGGGSGIGSGAGGGVDGEGDGKEKEEKEQSQVKKFFRGGSSRHKRSRSMGDAKAAAAIVQQPRGEGKQPGPGDKDKDKEEKREKEEKKQDKAEKSETVREKGHSRSGSTVLRRKGSFIGGNSFLSSFSTSTTKLPRHCTDDIIERPATSTDDAHESGEDQEGSGTTGEAVEATAQRRKWGSLPRRHNSQFIKKSSTMEVLSSVPTGSPSTKRNTLVSETNGNRMDRSQKRRYRILVSSPRGGVNAIDDAGDVEVDGDDPDDIDDESEDSGEEGDERKRATGAMGLLKGPRLFSGRDKRAGTTCEPVARGRNHRRTNSTDVGFLDPSAISDDLARRDADARYREMEDLQLGRPERRERNKRLSIHFEEALSNRPSYDSLVHRGILKEWNEPSYKSFDDFPPQRTPLIWSNTNTEGKIDGWNVERGVTSDFVLGAHFALEDEGYIPFFETYFYKSEFSTWWGADEKFGPILVSMLKSSGTGEADGTAQGDTTSVPDIMVSDSAVPTGPGAFGAGAILRRLGEKATGSKPSGVLQTQYRVLVQSKKGGKQLFIRSGERSAEKVKALRVALGAHGYLADEVALNDIRFKKVKDIDIREDLLYLEKKFFSTDYKFGILYAKKGQNENEMFSNQTGETSAHFQQFLSLLGEKVTLKGFKGYTGGLDIKTDTTGQESVYTEYKNQRIMFHVSTMLPFYPRDEQQVERKRHLGNDIVVIVFVEPGAYFDPTPMKTQFNHVYCVVNVSNEDASASTESTLGSGDRPTSNSCRVRVELAVKQGVRPFGPPLPDPSQTNFTLDHNFREFLLSKLINGERASLKSPAFAMKMEKTRRIFIEQLIDTKIHPKK